MTSQSSLPALPLAQWEPTKKTLHLYTQIVGKIRMALMPKQNHWWHVTLYVDTRGLTTGSIPVGDRRLTIRFDFIDHALYVSTSDGNQESLSLQNGLTVASFYKRLFQILTALDINADIIAKPYDHESTTPFAEDETHAHYDAASVERFWHILRFTDATFRRFNRDYCGKVCPVHLYWHSFDLAVTRFSGNRGPDMSGASRVEQEAYSHEVISFGFWPGDQNVRKPAYYSYTYPAPNGLDREPLQPKPARWVEQNGSPMALLSYEEVRQANEPGTMLMSFLESAYEVGATKAGWDTHSLKIN